MPPRKTAPSKSTGKRKAQDMSDPDIVPSKSVGKRRTQETPDSEIEIIEGDITKPPKEKSAVASTEKPVFKLFPGVSLIDRIDALQARAVPTLPATSTQLRKHTVGAVLVDETTPSSPSRPSRLKVKTEKLLLLDATKQARLSKLSARKTPLEIDTIPSDDSDSPPIKKSRFPRASNKARISDTSDRDPAPMIPESQTGVDANLPGAQSDTSDDDDPVEVVVSADSESDIVPDDNIVQAPSKIISTPPHRIRNSGGRVGDTTEVAASVNSESDVALDDSSKQASSEIAVAPPHRIRNRDLRSPSEDSEASETISNIPGDVGDIPVLDRALQDPDTYTMYDDLPYLQNICEVKAYGSGPPTEDCVRLSTLRQVVSERTLDLILLGLLFTNADCYVNTARIEPSKLATAAATSTSDSIKLRLTLSARKNENAVGVMIGMVTECFLVEEYTGISSDKPFSLHKITINPFPQEYRRDTALWGQMLNFRTIVGSVSAQGLSFNTRRKTSYTTTTFQSPRTPQKPNKYYMTVSSPLAPRAGGSSNRGSGGYAPSRRFDEKVPIYDGRAKTAHPFTFTAEDFSNLATWPIYKKGHADLPLNSLVAIGYTLNLYSWPAGSDNSQLSTNVQFVIFLGVPVA